MITLDDIKREYTTWEKEQYDSGWNDCIDHLHSQGLLMVWQPIESIQDTNEPALFLFKNGEICIAPCLKPRPLGNLSKQERKMLYDVTGRIGGDPDWELIAWMPLPKGGV